MHFGSILSGRPVRQRSERGRRKRRSITRRVCTRDGTVVERRFEFPGNLGRAFANSSFAPTALPLYLHTHTRRRFLWLRPEKKRNHFEHEQCAFKNIAGRRRRRNGSHAYDFGTAILLKKPTHVYTLVKEVFWERKKDD